MRVWLVSVLLFFAAIAKADLTVDNVEPGAIYRYPLISLRGKCGSGPVDAALDGGTTAQFSSSEGSYVALVELKPGSNMVLVKNGRDSVRIKVSYKPMTTPYRVRAVWFGADDESLDYVSHEPNKPQTRDEKIDLALKLIQTSTAEAMVAAGYGPKTFALETDERGKVKVFVVKSPKKADELRAMEGNETWSHAYQLFTKEFGEKNLKWAGLNAFTRFDKDKKKSVGHFALGGGALALFGSGSITYWPSSLAQFTSVMNDPTEINGSEAFEDSNNRKTVWANVATAYGAWWHELGHTLGLPHSADPFSVMSRGFDFFQRRFVAAEAPVFGKAFGQAFTGDQLTRLDKEFAARWNWNPFLQPDAAEETPKGKPPTILVEDDVVTLSADDGIRVVGGERDDSPAYVQDFPGTNPATKLILSLKEIKAQMKTEKPIHLVLVDSSGRETRWEEKANASGR